MKQDKNKRTGTMLEPNKNKSKNKKFDLSLWNYKFALNY